MDIEGIKQRFEVLTPFLNERLRRIVAGAEAKVYGYGGVSVVSRQTGVSQRAVALGCQEIISGAAKDRRIRKAGGGRKKSVDNDPGLVRDLEDLIEPVSRGDPESPLRWTCKSVRKLSAELRSLGHKASHDLVARLLRNLGYSLQSNRKMLEGASYPDRNAQFEYIYQKVKEYQGILQPVISVDTKKKELVGNFKNQGQEWHPAGQPEKVRVHDFEIPELGKVAPYGIYDLYLNEGWVNVGIDHDTAAFAVESIRRSLVFHGAKAISPGQTTVDYRGFRRQ